ncbi:VOC family protein [Microvirga rosea]|uniref:VOC family protein n=1 Tax=Microvirga rosea TaxID=2715425 RepID=UPI001D0B1748|nr:VOC family protein [Microvirga rosea]MCB8820121.1 VOC family protein [Microvirga rosea]
MMSRRDLLASATAAATLAGSNVPSAADNHPLSAIRQIDYTVIYARDMKAMRDFYQNVMRFKVSRELSADWIEYRIGGTVLALAHPHVTKADPAVPRGAAALQLAFEVERRNVDACADALRGAGVTPVSPPTDQPWGHRTLFFRDPDGNLLEIFAQI